MIVLSLLFLLDYLVGFMKLWGEIHNLLSKINAKNTCKGNNNDNVKILIKIMILLSKSAWTAGDFPAM